MPGAIGLWFGRLLQLPYAGIVVCGKLATLLIYAIIVTNAVRVVPGRKSLMALIALLPESLFLASGFEYDPWLNAWIMLGVAETMRETQRHDAPFTSVDVLRCIVPFMLGLSVKLIYFPILLMLLLMPRDRFRSRGSRAAFCAVVVALALALLASFALPTMLAVDSGAASDTRAAGNVNARLQILHMLADPAGTVGLFALVAVECLALPANAVWYTCVYYYLDFSSRTIVLPYEQMGAVALALVVLTVLLDVDDAERLRLRPLGRIWVAVLAALGIGFSVAALYVTFTPVGAPSVAGWQPRYLLAVLFPLLIAIELPRIRPSRMAVRVLALGGVIALSVVVDVCSVAIL